MILVGTIVFDNRDGARGRHACARNRALQREAGIEQARTAQAADTAGSADCEQARRARDDVLDAAGREVRVARDHERCRRGDIGRGKAGADRELVIGVAGPSKAVIARRENPVGHCAVAARCGQVDALAEVRVARYIALAGAGADGDHAAAVRGGKVYRVLAGIAGGHDDHRALPQRGIDRVLQRLRTRAETSEAHIDYARRVGIRRHARHRHAGRP